MVMNTWRRKQRPYIPDRFMKAMRTDRRPDVSIQL